MAQQMKLSILIDADASGAKSGGAVAVDAIEAVGDAGRRAATALDGVAQAGQKTGAGFDRANGAANASVVAISRIGQAANQSTTSVRRLIDAQMGLNAAAANSDLRAADIAAYGAKLDELRARYNPLYATISRYKTEVVAIRQAHAVGAISTNEMTAALSRERQATLASIEAIKNRNNAIRSTPSGAASGQPGYDNAAGITAQFQDIGVTAAMGMDPLQIALQQGTQLSEILRGMENPVRGLGAAFLQLLSPVSLVTIGVVGLAAAAVQYGATLLAAGKESEETLQRQRDLIGEVAQKWGASMPALKAYYEELQKAEDARKKLDATEGAINLSWAGARAEVKDINVAMAEMISRLQDTGVAAADIEAVRAAFSKLKTNVEGNKASVDDVRNAQTTLNLVLNNNSIPAVDGLATSYSRLMTVIAEASGWTKRFKDQNQEMLDAADAEREKWRAKTEAMLKLQEYYRSVYNPVPVGVAIPTPAEKPSLLDYDPDEEANRKLEAARKEAADKLEQQRKSYQDYLQTQNDGLARLEMEISLVGQSAEARARATAAFEAELKIRELGTAITAKEADGLRTLAQLQAERRLDLERQVAAYQSVQQAGATMIDQLTVGTGSLKDRLKSVAETMLTTFEQLAVANPLKNALLGQNNPTITDLFTGRSTSPVTSTAAMTVTAGTVMINGSPLGVPGASTLGGFLGAANTNVAAAANSNVPATDISAYVKQAAIARGIDPNVALKVAQSEGGLTSWNQQSNVVNSAGLREQSFGPYQLYMNGGLGNQFQAQTGLDPRLAQNGPAGVDYALDHAKTNGWSAWYGAEKAGISNWQGITPSQNQAVQQPVQVEQINQSLGKLSTATATASTNVAGLGDSTKSVAGSLTDVLGGNKLPGSVPGAASGLPANYFPPAPTAPTGAGFFPPAPTAPTSGIFSSLLSGAGTMFKSIFSGIGSFFTSIFGGLFANGAAFAGGNVIPFASGGVVDSPTRFAMSGNRTGLMGEAGPEAIMPLSRDGRGRLGVTMALPRQTRDGGGNLRLNLNSTHTVVVQGEGDKQLMENMRAGVTSMLEIERRNLHNSLPDLIDAYQRNPYARTSG